MPKLSIVIPIYNEEDNIDILFNKIKEAMESVSYPYEIIAVNDGSIDKSKQKLENQSVKDGRIKIINLARNFGQTAALVAGIDSAKGDIIVLMDADMENDPNDISTLVNELEKGYDIVSGWRKSRWHNKPFTRRMTSQVANWIISKISGLKLHDYGCTLKAYRKETIKNIGLYGEMHRFIPALAYWQGAKIKEIAVNFRPRKYGQSKYGMERILKVLLDMVTLKFLSGYATKPIYFFGKIAFYSFVASIFIFLWALYYKITGQKDFVETPLPIVFALFIILSVLLVLIGLLSELIMRIYHENKNKKIYVIRNKINFD